MEPAGVSGIVTISDKRSYFKIETLCRKNPTEIHGALSEVCGEFTVDRSTVSSWANHFCGDYASIDNDPWSGGPRTSTDERSVMLMAYALEEEQQVQQVKNFLKPQEQKLHRKMHKNRPQLLMVGPLILHDNARLHIMDVVIKKICNYGWEVLPYVPYNPDMSPPDFDIFPKLKEPMRR